MRHLKYRSTWLSLLLFEFYTQYDNQEMLGIPTEGGFSSKNTPKAGFLAFNPAVQLNTTFNILGAVE